MLTAKPTLLGLLLSLCALSSPAEPLKYAIVSSQTLPLANITLINGQYQADLDQGFLILLGEEMSRALDMELKVSVLLRKEVQSALTNGWVDMVCYQTPEWITPIANQVDWSDPFLRSEDILISKSKAAKIENLEDLKGKKIGLIKHYSYPLIEHLVVSQDITPIYSLSEPHNFIQLFRNPSIDAVILKKLTYQWLSSEHTGLVNKTRITIQPLVIELIEPRCAISRNKQLDLNKINRAVKRFKSKYGFD